MNPTGGTDPGTASRTTTAEHAGGTTEWWRQAVVYQVYPRSFADSGGDGVGDLRGLRERVPYLEKLGVDAVWLSPFYPSALADGGYDVDDYRDVDPLLGTLADFDALAATLRSAGLKLIVDIVPNHTSNRHPWFREALASPPGSPARDRYVFRDGAGPGGSVPPTDWFSGFGPSWTQAPDGQWYLHLHAQEQPDLNWDNPEVRDDFLTTLRFWADRGVDGFRVDVAHLLTKDLTAPLPSQAELADLAPGTHPFADRDEVHEVYAQWRAVFDEYDPPRTAVAEAWVTPSRRPRYASPRGLGQAFNFDLLRANWSRSEFADVIQQNLELAARSGSSSTWVLSNHDVCRHASRYALPQGTATAPQDGQAWLLSRGALPVPDVALGLRRARAATLLVLALPGSAYLYQGEELGLREVPDLPDDQRQDPVFRRSAGREPGRDGCRVPVPWSIAGPSHGFGPGPAHLPQPAWFSGLSVEAEQADVGSTLRLYSRALELRRSLATTEDLTWLETSEGVLGFARAEGWRSVTNFSDEPVSLPEGRVVLVSSPLTDDGMLPPDTTAWLC